MPQRDDFVYLADMVEYGTYACEFVRDRAAGDISADRQLAFSLVRALTVFGEAAAQVSSELRAEHADIPWREIVGMRNILVHGYTRVGLRTPLGGHDGKAAVAHRSADVDPGTGGPSLSDNVRMNPSADLPIELDMDAITAFCERNHIRKLSLFGSVLRDDFGPESDIDVLVEFEEGYRPGLAFFGMGDELAEILGRKVDFLTEGFLNKYIREGVLADARPVYAAA